jgi:hypothetical protein
MKRTKALFTVKGGVIPDQAMAEYTRRWSYNEEEFDQDCRTPEDQPTIFAQRLDEAHSYAKGLSNPAFLNWVRVEWIWI